MFRTCLNRIVLNRSKTVGSLRYQSATAFTSTPDEPEGVLCGAGGEIYGPEHYALQDRIPTVKLKIPWKTFLKSETIISVTFKL